MRKYSMTMFGCVYPTFGFRKFATSSLVRKEANKPELHYHHSLSTIEYVAASLEISKHRGNTTKQSGIICTIGPASRSVETIVQMIQSGMNIARLNFSHGSHEYHLESIRNIRKAVEICCQKEKRIVSVGIALDTKGPEIRTGILEGPPDKEIELENGERISITTDESYSKRGNKSFIYVDYPNIVNLVRNGSTIYVDDGLICLKVIKVERKNIQCEIENGGKLGSKKGVNLPGIHIDLPALSDKDKKDIRFAVEQKLDMIFASFVRDKHGIQDIRKLTTRVGVDEIENPAVIAKIENLQGIENLDEIIEHSDGLMVARGDLGIEMPAEKVFVAQKSMIAKCNLAGKSIICATQMLESMITKPRPTRAETSDVANAILDGADAVMLSGETAKGKYPVECVKVMSKICLEAEGIVPYKQLFMDLQKRVHSPVPINVSTAIAAVAAAEKSGASAILTITTTGRSAFLVSMYKPPCPIIAITTHPEVGRKCWLYRGVFPVIHTKPKMTHWTKDIDSRIRSALDFGLKSNLIRKNDTLIMMTGWRKGRGATNTMRIIHFTDEMFPVGNT